MRTHLLTAVALSALIAGPALAQSTAPTPSSGATTAPAAGAADGAIKMPHNTSAAATGTFIDAQDREQWLATNLIGTAVRGSSDENLGEVNDVLMDRNGNVVGAVIGVGGFLGVGEKDVAVPFNSLELVRNSDGDKLVLRKSKDELKAAPEFKEFTPNPPAASGTAAPGSTSAPMTPPATAR
ncbi:PRC-barrel domain-containing protein [Aquabacter cavernae]|uniref:PRC-barrel domain-containing protein n=1 Tax=Aquabacter cavernae TaxID=2496029 RepID=UPI000F8D1E93|nr:PRC-barrel domain-containing protein [Aquabacter cavernae]